jgi:hypothetical protein
MTNEPLVLANARLVLADEIIETETIPVVRTIWRAGRRVA